MDIFKEIGELINSVKEWVVQLPDMIDQLMERFIVWGITSYFEMKRDTLEFVYYNIGQPVLTNLNLSDQISTALSGINPQISAVLAYAGAFESLNIILSAYVTRFVLAFIPWA
ncbi:DUF2523 family protein [Gilvimarinus sp. DA14]|uniref:DUF2523 family protein n=1 Tax=Gilvimarinus sp. DA14 TaxID=2956798 RepID=UPI0020B7A4D0|nr:DUF2523 family protein [Gilvimarinus sp. DA14]UTF61279.1 DUF2523 domain-containing protein [Gilvimarinus sp. DA14]